HMERATAERAVASGSAGTTPATDSAGSTDTAATTGTADAAISEQQSTPTADTTLAAIAGKAGSNAITAASAHTPVAAGRGLPGKDIRVHIRA
ncbi:hypothetical protein, partial [Mycobacterium marinum]|uniref:hypothetical protein n=1 Tax=Mycobacterium marinum TaxID=1781 RepID=UPI003BAEEE30